MDSLQGMLLVATHQMADPRFQESVIFICNHDKHGALGLVLTQPSTEVSMEEIITSLHVEISPSVYPDLYCGGPVELDTLFFLHGKELCSKFISSVRVMDGVYWGNFTDLLTYLKGQHPLADLRFFLGYSGWGPGQLEQELGFDGWLVLPAADQDVFNSSSKALWRRVTQKHGINIDLFNDLAGQA